MPIYEYECTKCGHLNEIWQKFSDPPLTRCELCQGKIKKLISQSSFHLKGTGWYVTDYASNRGGNAGKDSPSSPSEKDTGSKEVKTATDKSKKETPSSGDT